MARTLMVQKLNMHPDAIEAQLAHENAGPLGVADHHAKFMEQRRMMLHEWAHDLQRLRTGAHPPAERQPPAPWPMGVQLRGGAPGRPRVL